MTTYTNVYVTTIYAHVLTWNGKTYESVTGQWDYKVNGYGDLVFRGVKSGWTRFTTVIDGREVGMTPSMYADYIAACPRTQLAGKRCHAHRVRACA